MYCMQTHTCRPSFSQSPRTQKHTHSKTVVFAVPNTRGLWLWIFRSIYVFDLYEFNLFIYYAIALWTEAWTEFAKPLVDRSEACALALLSNEMDFWFSGYAIRSVELGFDLSGSCIRPFGKCSKKIESDSSNKNSSHCGVRVSVWVCVCECLCSLFCLSIK